MQFRIRTASWLVALALVTLTPLSSSAVITEYQQDFELLDQTSLTALGDDGWLVFATVFASADTSFAYEYGPFPAPNDPLAPAFSQIDVLQGGAEQGLQQLVVISDYNNVDHGNPNGRLIESVTFREYPITSANVGEIWTFQFDAKLGNINNPTGTMSAQAFIKTIDPNNSFFQTNLVSLDMTTIPETWGTFSVELEIVPELVGQLFQIGFSNLGTNFDSSGIFYDNVDLSVETSTDAPSGATARNVALAQNYPNPFNPSTQIEFSLPEAGSVDLAVYDLAGRHVATLKQGNFGAGDHSVQWNGRSDDGVPVASGNYLYMLRTSQGSVTRTMTLLK